MVESKKKKKKKIILSHHIRHKTSFTNWPHIRHGATMIDIWQRVESIIIFVRHTKFVRSFLSSNKNK